MENLKDVRLHAVFPKWQSGETEIHYALSIGEEGVKLTRQQLEELKEHIENLLLSFPEYIEE
jgi:hypothetical protein